MTHPPMFSPVLLGLHGCPAGVDWLYQFTNNLTNLTTQNSDALSSVGMTLLAFVSFIKLVRMVADWNLSTMTISLNAAPVRVGDLVEFLIHAGRFACSSSTTGLPRFRERVSASTISSHTFAQVIVKALDQNSLSQLQSAMQQAT